MKLFVLLVLGWGLAILAIQNPGTVQLRFLGWQSQAVSLVGLVLVSALVGLAAGLLISPLRLRRSKPADDEE